jgi:WD40 repeat protein
LAENQPAGLQLQWQGQLSDLVTAIAWSPSGQSWVSSSAAGEVCWIDNLAQSGDRREILLLEPTGNSIDNLGFSADGRWLAAGGQTGQIFIWQCQPDRSPPQLVRRLEFQTWIDALVWHPCRSQLAIGCGSQVRIWAAATAGESMLQGRGFANDWICDRSSIFALAWHPSGNELAVAGYKGVEIWAPTAQVPLRHKLTVDTASIQLAWSPDGRYLAAGNLDRSLTIVDWQNPDDPWILQGCPGKIRQLVWLAHPERPCLAVATGDAVVLWDLAAEAWAGQLLTGHQGVVTTISAHPDLPLLISAASDGSACIWSADGEIAQIITSTLSGFTMLVWQPQGMCLATGSQMGEIGLWSNSA